MTKPPREKLSSVAAVIFNESKDSVLLIKRRDVPVWWVLPGGGVEKGEDPAIAVLREVREETGLEVRISRQVAIYSPINRLTHETHLFECRVAAGMLTIGEETQALQFFPLNKLPSHFFFVHHDWLTDTLKNEKQLMCKPLSQVTYAALFKFIIKHPIHVLRLFLSRLGLPINSSTNFR